MNTKALTTEETVQILASTELPRAKPRAAAVFESRGFARPEHPEHVERIKNLAALLWTELDNITFPPTNPEGGRLVALAKTELESSVMWGVKAISRFEPSKLAN